MDWIQLPKEERPELIMVYHEEPVATAQKFGPFSPKVDSLAKVPHSFETRTWPNCILNESLRAKARLGPSVTRRKKSLN